MDVDEGLFSSVPYWLGITPQQFDIVLAVYNLQLTGGRTNPKSILERYCLDSGKHLQRSNLFAQLRVLLDRGFLGKERAAAYSVDFDALESCLEGRRGGLVRELDEFNRVSADVRGYFRRMVLSDQRPRVFYMDYGGVMDSLIRVSKSASEVYTTSYFPTISYTYPLASGIGRAEYIKVLWSRCLEEGVLRVNYLTCLDVDFLFNHCFRYLGDPVRAYRESMVVLEELGNQVEAYDSLDVRFLRDLQGMDVFVPERGGVARESLLFTRDEHHDFTGAIYIDSLDIGSSMKASFIRNFDYAERVRGGKGEEILEAARRRLEEKYNV